MALILAHSARVYMFYISIFILRALVGDRPTRLDVGSRIEPAARRRVRGYKYMFYIYLFEL